MLLLNKTTLTLFATLLTVLANAQVTISVGQSSDNSYTQNEPAKFTATYPESDTVKNSHLINSYLSLNIAIGSRTTLSATGELQRNTLIEKEQHVEQVGLKFSTIVVLKNVDDSVGYWLWNTDFSAKYSNDKIEKAEGAQFIWSNSFAFPHESVPGIFSSGRIWPNDSGTGMANILQLKHVHNFGIEDIRYESLTMVNVSLGIEAYPFSGLLFKAFKKYSLLMLKWDYVNRFEISDSDSQLYVGPYYSLGAFVNYKFDPQGRTSFKVGYEKINGGNPMKGLADQTYGQLTVGVKINTGK